MMQTLFLVIFGSLALAGALLMLVLSHPMRVALALAGTMISLAAVYAVLGLHVVAVFQVLIYVGAVMVFMVYAIMLFEVRDTAGTPGRWRLAIPGLVGLVALGGVLTAAVLRGAPVPAGPGADFGVQAFARAFLADFWLYFELASVLLVAAVVAAIAVLRAHREPGDG
jgi:NADH-quinone oxidoreductase subunit J